MNLDQAIAELPPESLIRVGVSLRKNWHKVDFAIRAEMFQGQKRKTIDRMLHWPAGTTAQTYNGPQKRESAITHKGENHE